MHHTFRRCLPRQHYVEVQGHGIQIIIIHIRFAIRCNELGMNLAPRLGENVSAEFRSRLSLLSAVIEVHQSERGVGDRPLPQKRIVVFDDGVAERGPADHSQSDATRVNMFRLEQLDQGE